MSRMGSYCKAHLVRDLAAFPGWSPDLAALRPADEGEPARAGLRDDDILYLQETFAVTDGIFLDEHVVFEGNDPAWWAFCEGPLGFAPPADLAEAALAADAAPAAEAAQAPA